MKKFLGTVISGAIGLAALYAVGKIAFHAGHDIAEAEFRYEQLQNGIKEAETEVIYANNKPVAEVKKAEEEVLEKKQRKIGTLFGLKKIFSKGGGSVIGNLLSNPEDHVIEACVKGREIHVNVKPKMA